MLFCAVLKCRLKCELTRLFQYFIYNFLVRLVSWPWTGNNILIHILEIFHGNNGLLKSSRWKKITQFSIIWYLSIHLNMRSSDLRKFYSNLMCIIFNNMGTINVFKWYEELRSLRKFYSNWMRIIFNNMGFINAFIW